MTTGRDLTAESADTARWIRGAWRPLTAGDHTEVESRLAAIEAAAVRRDREGLVEVVARRIVERAYETGMEWPIVLIEARRLLGIDQPDAGEAPESANEDIRKAYDLTTAALQPDAASTGPEVVG